MELIYSFTTTTAKTLSDDGHVRECFGTSLVEIALRHEFLLHAVLALAAFHKAYLLQEQEQLSDESHGLGPLFGLETYMLAAHTHHTSALHSFSQRITHIDSDNCHALFGCAALLFVTSLARPRDKLDDTNSTVRFAEWVNLIRGVAAIVRDADSKGWLSSGPLRIIFNLTPAFPPRKSNVNEDLRICSEMHLDSLSSAISSSSSPTTNTACQAAIQTLHAAFSSRGRSNLALTWPTSLSREYMALLDTKSSEALLVLAYYCVLLRSLHHRWWIRGWPQYMLENIRGMVGEEWMRWLEWPTQQICGMKGNEV
jgi:hypothetical protein